MPRDFLSDRYDLYSVRKKKSESEKLTQKLVKSIYHLVEVDTSLHLVLA